MNRQFLDRKTATIQPLRGPVDRPFLLRQTKKKKKPDGAAEALTQPPSLRCGAETNRRISSVAIRKIFRDPSTVARFLWRICPIGEEYARLD